MKSSKLIISLDFELRWGVFDMNIPGYDKNILGARQAIPEMLKLFDKYDIHVTWAVVGLLFNETKDDYIKYKPVLRPSYKNTDLDAYSVHIGDDEKSDKFHYAHSLIDLILSYPNQEVASHSYSHYYCNEEGQNINQFEDDIKTAVKIAKDKFDVDLKSFVFPRNAVNHDYVKILHKYQFTSYRENSNKFNPKGGLVSRLFRLLDAYIGISDNLSGDTVVHHKVRGIYGNRFLRPYSYSFLNFFLLRRVKREMKFAAKNNSIYHLWWHPHNFGKNRKQNLQNLEEILKEYQFLENKFNMQSVCMKNL